MEGEQGRAGENVRIDVQGLIGTQAGNPWVPGVGLVVHGDGPAILAPDDARDLALSILRTADRMETQAQVGRALETRGADGDLVDRILEDVKQAGARADLLEQARRRPDLLDVLLAQHYDPDCPDCQREKAEAEARERAPQVDVTEKLRRDPAAQVDVTEAGFTAAGQKGPALTPCVVCDAPAGHPCDLDVHLKGARDGS